MTQNAYYKHHIFFCLNQRESGESCCADQGAQEAFAHCKAQVKAAGLTGAGGVRVNKAGCLDRCADGPVMVIYPEGIWYTFIDAEDVEEIIQSHLIQGRPVGRLQLA